MENYIQILDKLDIPAALTDSELKIFAANRSFFDNFAEIETIFPESYYAGYRPDFSVVVSGRVKLASFNTVLKTEKSTKLYNIRLLKLEEGRFVFCATAAADTYKKIRFYAKKHENIKSSRKSIEMLLDKISGLAFVHDNDKIYYANRRACDFLGFKSSSALYSSGRCLCSFFVNTSKQTLSNIPEWKELISSGMLKSSESIICMKNSVTGEPHCFLADVAVNNAETGDFISVFTDITELLEKEREKAASNAYFKEMFMGHSAPMLLVDQDNNGKILDANHAACVFYGYDRAELTSLTIDYLNIMPVESIKAEMSKAKARSRNYFNFIHRLKDGNVKNVEVYSSPIMHADKKVLYSIILDSTDKKLYEIQLKEMNEKLNSRIALCSQENLIRDSANRTLLNISRDAVFVFQYTSGVPGRFTDLNHTAENLCGMDEIEIKTKTVFEILEKLQKDSAESIINTFVQNGYYEGMLFSGESAYDVKLSVNDRMPGSGMLQVYKSR